MLGWHPSRQLKHSISISNSSIPSTTTTTATTTLFPPLNLASHRTTSGGILERTRRNRPRSNSFSDLPNPNSNPSPSPSPSSSTTTLPMPSSSTSDREKPLPSPSPTAPPRNISLPTSRPSLQISRPSGGGGVSPTTNTSVTSLIAGASTVSLISGRSSVLGGEKGVGEKGGEKLVMMVGGGEEGWEMVKKQVGELFTHGSLPPSTSLEELNDLVLSHISLLSRRVSPSTSLSSLLSSDISSLISLHLTKTVLPRLMNFPNDSQGNEKMLTRLNEVWVYFWAGVVPYLEGIFLPGRKDERVVGGKGKGVDVRELAVREFRDSILLAIEGRLWGIFEDEEWEDGGVGRRRRREGMMIEKGKVRVAAVGLEEEVQMEMEKDKGGGLMTPTVNRNKNLPTASSTSPSSLNKPSVSSPSPISPSISLPHTHHHTPTTLGSTSTQAQSKRQQMMSILLSSRTNDDNQRRVENLCKLMRGRGTEGEGRRWWEGEREREVGGGGRGKGKEEVRRRTESRLGFSGAGTILGSVGSRTSELVRIPEGEEGTLSPVSPPPNNASLNSTTSILLPSPSSAHDSLHSNSTSTTNKTESIADSEATSEGNATGGGKKETRSRRYRSHSVRMSYYQVPGVGGDE